jgi:2-polyprenyl-6-methoxyphenol hydroxylase-like FAD-dependent oxidoreductase
MLAAELALARVDVAIVERRATQELDGARAGGLHPRSLEVLDQRGVADRFVAQGQKHHVAPLAVTPLDISDLPTRHNYTLGLWQDRIEQILADWVSAPGLAVPMYRGVEVKGFVQHAANVDVELSDGRSLRAEYLVGCDGGRSQVRKQAGIEFPGWDASTSYLIAVAKMAAEAPYGIRRDGKGTYGMGKLEDGRVRIVLREEEVRQGDATLADLQQALVALYGSDYGVHDLDWLSRFSDMTRQAATYRQGRVLLAGDAAHVHSPAAGQGLNLGLQDAVNLGWKLAQVVKGVSPESLLDTYHSERHPVGARVLQNTMALTALGRGDVRGEALSKLVAELLQVGEARKRFASMMAGLDVHYDLGQGHPLLGRRMPDLDLQTEGGAKRVFSLLHQARPVLLNFGDPDAIDVAEFADRVRWINASYAGIWELPALGAVAAPSAVLIRPDGYVAWVGEGTDQGLSQALRTWCGAPQAA